MNSGPLGQKRGVAFVILIGIVTFGIYWLYWVFKTQEEMKQRTGQGLGGVLGLVIWIVVAPVSAFVIPSELGNMYAGDGSRKPVTGWTGLWLLPLRDLLDPRHRLGGESARLAQPLLGRGRADRNGRRGGHGRMNRTAWCVTLWGGPGLQAIRS